MARGSFMINSRIAEEDEEDQNNDTFEGTALSIFLVLKAGFRMKISLMSPIKEKTQPEIPEVIPEADEEENNDTYEGKTI